MPGLLGLDSLEKNRAIIDTGKRIMIYPGPGEVQYILPPGSVTMPLTKNPHGGHLCLPVCEYVKAAATRTQNQTIVQPKKSLPVESKTKPQTAERPSVVDASATANVQRFSSAAPDPGSPPRIKRSDRILVVEDQPIASCLFTDEGYAVEKRTHSELLGTGAQNVNGRIKESSFAAVWLTLPRDAQSIPNRKFSAVTRTIATWFRIAAIIGTAVVLMSPKGRSWMDESIQALLTDNVAKESLHRCCRYNATLLPENTMPSSSVYTMCSNLEIPSSLYNCLNKQHINDYMLITGKQYNEQRRLAVDAVMVQGLWNRVKQNFRFTGHLKKI